MIYPIAMKLKIPVERVFANNIIFDSNGNYEKYDESELTSRDGGKAAVIKKLQDSNGYNPIVMIGDGVTDMQASPPADVFIGTSVHFDYYEVLLYLC